MDAGATTLDAFRFLDVRSPKPAGSNPQPTYVVTRDKLRFPLTELEKALSALKYDQDYDDELNKVLLTNQVAAKWPTLSGYVDHLAEYEARLAGSGSSPEEVHKDIHDLFKKRSVGLSVKDYLSTPAARS